MLTRIHVNKHHIARNRKGEALPVLTAKDYKRNRRGNTVRIMAEGVEVARVVYRPEKPLSCGAVAYIETQLAVEVEE